MCENKLKCVCKYTHTHTQVHMVKYVLGRMECQRSFLVWTKSDSVLFCSVANSIKQRKPRLLLPPPESGSESSVTILKGETLLLECFAEGLWVTWPCSWLFPLCPVKNEIAVKSMPACIFKKMISFRRENPVTTFLGKVICTSLCRFQAVTKIDL